MDGKYYQLIIEIFGDDWERQEEYFFKGDIIEAVEFKDEHERSHKNEKGNFIPNIYSIDYTIMELTEEEVRSRITVSEYLRLNPTIIIIPKQEKPLVVNFNEYSCPKKPTRRCKFAKLEWQGMEGRIVCRRDKIE